MWDYIGLATSALVALSIIIPAFGAAHYAGTSWVRDIVRGELKEDGHV